MVDQRIIDEDFANIEIEVEPYNKDLYLTEKVQHSLSKLFALYEAGRQYKALRSNSAGELLVSSEGGQVSTGTVAQVAVGTTATLILASNVNRREVLIENMGINDCYIGFGSGVTTANGFLLPAGTSFSTDKYTGNFYAIRDSATTCSVSVMEL